MYKLLRKASIPGIIAVCLLAFSGCSEQSPAVADTASLAAAAGSAAKAARMETSTPVLDRVLEQKILKVGMSGTQPPMNAVSRTGQLLGYEVDLARTLAGAMGARLKIETMPFSELLAALQAGEIDMAMSGIAITAERSRDFTFVGPYMMSGKSVLTKSTFLANATQPSDFNSADLTLAALKGSTSQSFIEEKAPKTALVTVENYDAGVAMVISGEVDGMVADMPICVLSVLRHPDAGLATLKAPVSIEPFGIALSKDDQQFAQLVDNYLDTYSKLGLLTKLRKKWFEDKSWIAALP